MKQTDYHDAKDFRISKRNVLSITVTVMSIIFPLAALTDDGTTHLKLLDLVAGLTINISIFGWCYYDGFERGRQLGFGFRTFLVVFSFFALFVYLFYTRGLLGGLRSTALAFLVITGMIIVTLVSGAIILLFLASVGFVAI